MVVVELAHDEYACRLVLQVDDAEVTATAVNDACGPAGG